MRKLLRTDGSVMLIGGPQTSEQIKALIRCESVDSRMLDDRVHVLIFDDVGALKDLPINAAATRLYHAAGYSLQQYIHGHAVIVPDADFAKDNI